MNPSPDDHDPADRLLDALLREQSRRRDADENLLDAIETALDAQRPGAMNRSGSGSGRRGILLAFAAGIAMSAGGFFIWQQSRSSSSTPTLAKNDEAPLPQVSTVPRQAKLREHEEPEVLASRRMPEPEVMEPSDTLAQADTSGEAQTTFEAPAAPAPAAAIPPLARNALRSAPPPAAAVAPVAGASAADTVPAGISEVRFLAWDDATAAMKIDVIDGDQATPIRNMHPLKRTGWYSVSASQPLKLRLEGRVAPADGASVDQEVNLMGFVKPLVIVMPNPKAASGLAAVVINDDEANFKWGTYLVFNATSGDLALTMDKQATKVPTGWRPVLITPPPTNAGGVATQIRTYKEPNKVVYSNIWPVDKDARLLVLVFPGKDNRLPLDTKTIADSKAMHDAERQVIASKATAAALAAKAPSIEPPKPAELPAPEGSLASTLPADPEASRLAGIDGTARNGDAGGSGGGHGGGLGSGRGTGAGAALEVSGRASSGPWGGGRGRMNYDAPGSDSQTREPANGERYGQLVDQSWKSPWKESLSTFSIDVDSASYTNIRRMIREGQPIPPDAVRIEECLNYFDYRYPVPKEGHPFAVQGSLVTSPFRPDALLARVAIKGREIENAARPASNLIFLIDVSGSMQASNKLPLLKRSLEMLVDQLDERDRLGIVVYAGNEGVALDSTKLDAAGKERARNALRNLEAGGSTNGGAGLRRAYDLAAKGFVAGGVNRVILATDGDFNVGTTGQSDLVELVKEKAKSGVALTVASVGEGNLNDSMLEAITKDGNGNYYYLDSDSEARRIFLQKLTGTLVTIAKDVKIQVEFNPGKVKAYRLLGYSDRILKHEDFNNDKVDAGDIGAGHTVTAFYEIVPQGAEMPAIAGVDPLRYQKPADREIVPSDEWFNLKLRYKAPDGDVSSLIEAPLKGEPQKWDDADLDLRFASSVALFGMKLRQLPEVKDIPWSRVEEMAQPALKDDPREQRAEFIELVKKLAR